MPPASKAAAGVGRKLGPLPLYAWALLAAAVLGYFLFVRKPTGAKAQAAVTAAQDTGAMPGAATAAGSSQDNGQATADLLAAYGQQNDAWIGAFLHQSDTIAQLAGKQIDWATAGGGGSGIPYGGDNKTVDIKVVDPTTGLVFNQTGSANDPLGQVTAASIAHNWAFLHSGTGGGATDPGMAVYAPPPIVSSTTAPASVSPYKYGGVAVG